MADEPIVPGTDQISPEPPDRPGAAAAVPKVPVLPRPAPAVSIVKKASAAEWLRVEISHFVASLVLAGAAVGVVYSFGYDFRVAAVAGVLTIIFGRTVTRFVLPDHKPASAEIASAVAAAPATDTMREIVETIVFVVVLVLLLKSFVAEAFVIPTGSMATTLWGYQKVVECPECGYKFPVNASLEADPQDGMQAQTVRGCVCPNCRFVIDFGNPGPSWNSGDRVLVAKFLYDLLERLPDRLDVVVFKFPGDNQNSPWPESGPFGPRQVPMNYIKRLIGLPGEVVAIHQGNLYRIAADNVPPDVRKQFAEDAEKAAHGEANELWRKPFTHTQFGADARDFFESNKDRFEIIRKPPETMLAMRRIVYDNDHPARDLSRKRWIGSGWKGDANNFTFNGSDSDPWLHYQHILRESGGRPQLITDFMGYNTARYFAGSGKGSGMNWVNDLMVECEATIAGNSGTLTLELSRGLDRFQARIDLATGICKLVRIADDGEQVLDSQPTSIKKPGTYRLRLADFDNRLTLWVDDALPFGDGVAFTPPDDSGPIEKNDLDRPASIGATGASVQLKHLQVWRDTYYTIGNSYPNVGDVENVNWSDPADWSRLRRLPYRTMDVQPGHFLCLGDNSPESSDGRAWGLVPERLLLGRALLVYFPFDRAGRIR